MLAATAALFLLPLRSQVVPATAPYQPRHGGTVAIGMNLAAVPYYAKSVPFLDRFKTSGSWTGDQRGVPVALDANGYPTAVPVGSRAVVSLFAIDLPAYSPNDSYILTYQGSGRIRLSGAAGQETDAPGRITFRTKGESSIVSLHIQSMADKDPIRDIHVVRADQWDRFARGEIFDPAYLAFVSHFSVLRFMDWGNTNDIKPVSWKARSQPGFASWSLPTDGVPIETMVALANAAHADMWYTVRAQADDEFVRNAMIYIRDHLDRGLRLHLEYGNEVWNWGFPVAHWADDRAKAMWGATRPHSRMTFYGYRAAQVQMIARRVFGTQAPKRLIGVMGAFLALPTLSKDTLDGVHIAHPGPASDLFGEYAIALYFGLKTDKDSSATIAGWARSGSRGLDAAFREMEFGGTMPVNLSVAAITALAAQHVRLAKDNGMRLVAYEANASLVPNWATDADRNDIIDFYRRLVADPRMGTLYDSMATHFALAGGTLLNNFNDVGDGDKWGFWGIVPSPYKTATPRYETLVKIADRAKAGASHKPDTAAATRR